MKKRRFLELSDARSSQRVKSNANRKVIREVRNLKAPLQLGRVPVYVRLGGTALPDSSDDGSDVNEVICGV